MLSAAFMLSAAPRGARRTGVNGLVRNPQIDPLTRLADAYDLDSDDVRRLVTRPLLGAFGGIINATLVTSAIFFEALVMAT